MKNKSKINKKLFPAALAILVVFSFVFYVDFLKQSNKVLPILTKTQEETEANITEEETSAHTKPTEGFIPPLPEKLKGEKVILNTKTLKYHKYDCEWVKECRNCIVTTKKEAIKKGAKPCTSCL